MSFVDLAGSERLKTSKSEGTTLKETGSINKSIFTLGKVISSLCDRKKVKVPFRESKLTQLLMDSIGGTSLTVMIACVSPATAHLSETIRTLDYASRAKNIKNRPVVLLDPQQNIVNELKKEIESLRAENQALRVALNTSVSMSREDMGTAFSAPDQYGERKVLEAMPNEQLRHSYSFSKAHAEMNRSSDSVLSFPSPRERDGGQRRSQSVMEMGHSRLREAQEARDGKERRDRSPFRQLFHEQPAAHRNQTNDPNQRPHNHPWQRSCSPDAPTTFKMPEIKVSARSKEEILAEERALLGEMESMTKYSYFEAASPSSYKHQSKDSNLRDVGHTSRQEWEDRYYREQRVKTTEKKLREEIMRLPEAEDRPYQRKMFPPGQKGARSQQSNTKQKSSQRSPVDRNVMPERQGLKELEKLSKYSYFNDVEREPQEPSPPRHTYQNSQPNKQFAGLPSSNLARQANPGRGQAPSQQPPKSYSAQYGTYANDYPQPGHSTSIDYNDYRIQSTQLPDEEVRYRMSSSTESGIYSRQSEAVSPKSIRSSGALHLGKNSQQSTNPAPYQSTHQDLRGSSRQMYLGSDFPNQQPARPSSADADKLLDEAFDEVISIDQRKQAAADDWMAKLNPLAGMDLDKMTGDNWHSELERVVQQSRGNDVASFLAASTKQEERPRSSGRPPSVPRPSSRSGEASGRQPSPQPHHPSPNLASSSQPPTQFEPPRRQSQSPHGYLQESERFREPENDTVQSHSSATASRQPRKPEKAAPRFEEPVAESKPDPTPYYQNSRNFGQVDMQALAMATGRATAQASKHPHSTLIKAAYKESSSYRNSQTALRNAGPANPVSQASTYLQPEKAAESPSFSAASHLGDGTSSYEALMKSLEQSRAKAQAARKSILEKKEEWKSRIK